MSSSNENPVTGRRPLRVPGESSTPKPVNDIPLPAMVSLPGESPVPSIKTVSDPGAPPRPPVFSRSPRDFIPFPRNAIEIRSPGDAGLPPSSSLLSLLASFGGSLVYGFSNWILWIVSLPMTLLGLYNYRRTRSDFKKNTSKRAQRYQAYLDKHHQTLTKLADQQRRASLIPNPDLEECSHRAITRSSRLWERKPNDPDFLEIRLGIGSAHSTFEVIPPALVDVTRDPDDLFEAASSLSTSFEQIDGVAINLPLSSVVTAGLIGQRQVLITMMRALLVQLATHHAPSEVKLVLIIPETEVKEWEWARWLPHTWSNDRQSRSIAAGDAATHRILTSLEQHIKQRKNQQSPGQTGALPSPAYIFVFADQKVWRGPQAMAYGPLLELLLKEGAALGAYSIFLSDSQIPKDCGALIDLNNQPGVLKFIGPSPHEHSFTPDFADSHLADRFARALAPLRLERTGDSSDDLPTVIPLLELLQITRVEDLNIADQWSKTRADKSLAVPLGIRSGNKPLILDLHERAHGPHALLAGTSGSGKSELLQALIVALSARFSPEKVAFILVDFKALMVPPFQELPHQVGIITNLEGNEAVRALIGLEAEKERRQRLFLQAGKSSIDDYQELYFQGKVPEPLPHLIIIVDEFAELAVNQPDFIQGLVSLSRVGRSLGIHLLLATQKPAGVVSETIWANARSRLSLRVERVEDSQEVLKRPDAAAITAQQKGRAYLQVGMNEIFEQFQVAWATAPYQTSAHPSSTALATRIDLDGSPHPLDVLSVPQPAQTSDKTHLSVLVDQIIRTRQQQKDARPLKRPWLPPLEKTACLKNHRPALGGWDGQGWQKVERWLNPYVGVYDNPAGQLRGDLSLPLGKEGNLVIYGAPGSGKTTLLQTMITSLMLDHSPADVHLYILDFGGRSYKVFETLPHVGAIVVPDENERILRVLQFIKLELDRRKKLLEPFGGKISAYRAQFPGALADIVLILDNYTAFANTYNEQIIELSRLASEGGGFGMHLVITANTVSALPMSLASNIPMAIALELVDPNDYISVVGRTNGLTPARGIAGRGLIKGTPPVEFQTALPAETEAEFKDLLQAMSNARSAGCACSIPPRQDVVPLQQILTTEKVWAESQAGHFSVPIGLDLGTPGLDSLNVDLTQGTHFWIGGPPSTGKSTLLQTWLLALAERYSPKRLRLYLVDMGCTSLTAFHDLPHMQSYIVNNDQFEAALVEINNQLDERARVLKQAAQAGDPGNPHSSPMSPPALVMAIEGLDQLRQESSEDSRKALHTLMRRKGLGLHVLATGACPDFSSYSQIDNLGVVFKEFQAGFLVGYNNYDDLQYVPIKLSPLDTQKYLPAGSAFYVQRGGSYRVVQVASSQHGAPGTKAWIAQIISKTEASQ